MRRKEKLDLIRRAKALADWALEYQNLWTEALSFDDYSTLDELTTVMQVYIRLCAPVEPGLAPNGWYLFREDVESWEQVRLRFDDMVVEV